MEVTKLFEEISLRKLTIMVAKALDCMGVSQSPSVDAHRWMRGLMQYNPYARALGRPRLTRSGAYLVIYTHAMLP